MYIYVTRWHYTLCICILFLFSQISLHPAEIDHLEMTRVLTPSKKMGHVFAKKETERDMYLARKKKEEEKRRERHEYKNKNALQ